MISVLAQPGFQQRALPLSVKVWHAMIRDGLAPDRAELIRGVIMLKMPKSTAHTLLTSRMQRRLAGLEGCGWHARKEDPLTFADSEPEPDLSVVRGTEEDYKNHHPSNAALVVEVSVSTLAEDRAMADIYAEAGVPEYWIVNAADRCVEVYRQPRDGAYTSVQTIKAGEPLTCAEPPVTVDTAALFADLPAVG